MACAITAQKLCIPVAHIEGGIRSDDWTMPEEINRMVTDSITNYFFTTSETANENLARSGVPNDRVFFVGNTMIDTWLANIDRLTKPSLWVDLGLSAGDYFVITLHRPANVDRGDDFARLLQAIGEGARGKPVIFPVHPRSAKSLEQVEGIPKNVFLTEPQSYLEFNYLVKHAKAVITDSGGITEEATVMGIPCMTLRDNTERPETITVGTNELVGTDPDALQPFLDRLFAGEWKEGGIPEKWDGKTGERIVAELERILCR
jgi:UDP-N-acetylglucosamine 2-epimerase (non-hydrolysing)